MVSVLAVAVTRDGRWAISGSDDKTVKLWDSDGVWRCERWKAIRIRWWRWPSHQTGGALCPVLYDILGCTLKVWDLEREVELATLRGEHYQLRSVTVTPDGRRAVSCSGNDELSVWDLDRGIGLPPLASSASAN